MHTLTPATQAEAAADLNSLPHARITTQGTEAHVFTNGLDDLTAWWYALSGHITTQEAGTGVCMWTLHTHTDPTNPASTPIRVHALALDTDQPDADLTTAHAA